MSLDSKPKITTRDNILYCLKDWNVLTAAQIHRIAVEAVGRGAPSLATISSELRRLCEAGLIEEVEGFGPRGGNGYRRMKEV